MAQLRPADQPGPCRQAPHQDTAGVEPEEGGAGERDGVVRRRELEVEPVAAGREDGIVGHRTGEAELGHHQVGGRGVSPHLEGLVLVRQRVFDPPVAPDIVEARPGPDDVAVARLRRQVLVAGEEGQHLGAGIGARYPVAARHAPFDEGQPGVGLGPVAASVQAPEFDPGPPPEPGVGAVAEPDLVATTPLRLQVDDDRDACPLPPELALRPHLDAAEVGALREVRLELDQPLGAVAIAGLEGHVTLEQRGVQDVLVEGDVAE